RIDGLFTAKVQFPPRFAFVFLRVRLRAGSVTTNRSPVDGSRGIAAVGHAGLPRFALQRDVAVSTEDLYFGQRERAAARQLDTHIAAGGGFEFGRIGLELGRNTGQERSDLPVGLAAEVRIQDQRDAGEQLGESSR